MYILIGLFGNYYEDSETAIIAISRNNYLLNSIQKEFENAKKKGWKEVYDFFVKYDVKNINNNPMIDLIDEDDFNEFIMGKLTRTIIYEKMEV